MLSIGSVLKENGYEVSLLDCLDRNHPSLVRFQGLHCAKNRYDGTGRYVKEFIEKPNFFSWVPRRYGRYGLPLSIVEKELEKFSPPDVVFLTSGMTYWYPGVVEMISLLKRKFAEVPVILGGIYATLCPEHARKMSGADQIILGEGEIQCLKIADEISGNDSDITRYQNLDDFPWPLYDLYECLDSVALMTSRGCPYRCSYCGSRLLATEYRRRCPLKVVDEIESINRKRGVGEFAFYDDALLVDKEDHIIPILEEIIRRELRTHFHTPNGIHPREVDERLANLMYKAGFKTIRLSYETSNRERQKSMGFKVNNDDLINAVNHLVNAGFDPRTIGSYVLVGLPGQEVEEVVDSMLFVLHQGIKVSLASFSPIPGTRIWKEAVEQVNLSLDADPLLTNNSIFPMRSEAFSYEAFLKLGTLSAIANRILNKGRNPLKDTEFMNYLKKFLK